MATSRYLNRLPSPSLSFEWLKRRRMEMRSDAHLRSSSVRHVRGGSAGAKAVVPTALKSFLLPCVCVCVCVCVCMCVCVRACVCARARVCVSGSPPPCSSPPFSGRRHRHRLPYPPTPHPTSPTHTHTHRRRRRRRRFAAGSEPPTQTPFFFILRELTVAFMRVVGPDRFSIVDRW